MEKSLNTKEVKIKFKDPKVYEKFNHIEVGDWIDLRTIDVVTLKKGQFRKVDLGVAMELPAGYEALLVPRSSTFKNYGVLQANSMAVVDNSFKGDDDYWSFLVLATEDVTIPKGARICQFRIMKNQPKIDFKVVDKLDNDNRGGMGSTGTM
ncbi:MAG: deoxyuridine 5'-triphosphate nucleotidohydrolase [Peptoniphilus lacydonensis]|uniref:dUTP diphosphatase n=1 Tax=Peptoniphilus lacydonensis TaxID=1673725 RepID=UPI00290156AB|nr:deoxyuridine 5'-triphosphate nucleotidohydrolase [Peptoniphilus lacydonensis]MDU2116010.1 deoxyuridine 5'-triphosphate nucleotidohydrolase [Peptoniphilus lacydonensis]